MLRLDSGGRAHAVYPPSFPGLEPDRSPSVVFVEGSGRDLYLGQEASYALDHPESVSTRLSGIPDSMQIIAMEHGPQELVRLRWISGDDSGWYLLRRPDFAPLATSRTAFKQQERSRQRGSACRRCFSRVVD